MRADVVLVDVDVDADADDPAGCDVDDGAAADDDEADGSAPRLVRRSEIHFWRKDSSSLPSPISEVMVEAKRGESVSVGANGV